MYQFFRSGRRASAFLAMFFCLAFATLVGANDTTGGLPANASAVPVLQNASRVVTLVKQVVLDRHTPSLYRHWQRQDTIYRRANPWGDDFCRSIAIRDVSGYACDATAWKRIPEGTVLFVPSGVIFAEVPAGIAVPGAIALAKTSTPNVLMLAPNAPVVTPLETRLRMQVADVTSELALTKVLMIVYGVVAVAFVVFSVMFCALYRAADFRLHERDKLITAMDFRLRNLRKRVDTPPSELKRKNGWLPPENGSPGSRTKTGPLEGSSGQ